MNQYQSPNAYLLSFYFKQLHQIWGVIRYEFHHAPIHLFQEAFPGQVRIVADVKKAAHVRATHTDEMSSFVIQNLKK